VMWGGIEFHIDDAAKLNAYDRWPCYCEERVGVRWSGVFMMAFDSEWYVTNMMVSRIGGCSRLQGKFCNEYAVLMGSQCN